MKIKQFVLGFVLGGILFSSIPALAKDLTKIDVLFDNIKVKLNGNEYKMEEEPFIYNGRTYVPLRYMANMFGATVKYNETESTVEVQNISTQAAIETGVTKKMSEYMKEQNDKRITDLNTPQQDTQSKSTLKAQTTTNNKNVIKSIDEDTIEKDGIRYVKLAIVARKIYGTEYNLARKVNNSKIQFDLEKIANKEKQDTEVLISDISHIDINGISFIEEDYYQNKILPLIQ